MRFRRHPEPELSTWERLSRRFSEARVVVLDGPVADRQVLLASLNATEHSTLGALVANCGGVTVDHGWLRLLAGGSSLMPSLPDMNLGDGHSTEDYLVIGHDVLGGRFAINGRGDRAAPGEVCYLAPDTLEWLALGMGHTAFVEWVLGSNLGLFYRDLRWPGWELEVDQLAPDQALASYPPPFAAQGGDLSKVRRSAVPATELFAFLDDAARQLAAVADGQAFEFNFDK